MSFPGRRIALIGAPSSIGIRPYDESGLVREIHRAPALFRELELARRLDAADTGDVFPPSYVDFDRPPGRARNEAGVESYSRALAARISAATARGDFVVLVGGECSIVLGALLGARRGSEGYVGLAYVDGHADFATPSESVTGSVASMCLALAVGRGDSPLARLSPDGPLVRGEDVALIGRRDDADARIYGEDVLAEMGVLDLTAADIMQRGAELAVDTALARLTRPGLAGFWIHIDADVLDPAVMPAVDSPDPGGLSLDTVADLLRPLVRHPRALGLELTIYDPGLDPDGSCARRLAALLECVLAGGTT
ncbi:MAG TPA: arginase family protein [Gemmatimonadaceae bacterium]|jgi:arginase|nr:arginase family protein [Gemmatimonadaceae bacterium]